MIQHRRQSTLLKGAFGLGLGFGIKPVEHLGPQGGHIRIALAHALGELVIRRRQVLFLDSQGRSLKGNFLAGKLGPGVILRDDQDEIFGYALEQALQMLGKAGKGQHILRMGDKIHGGIIDDFHLVHHAAHIQSQQVAELGGPGHRFPGGRFPPQPVDDPVNLLVADGCRRLFQPQLPEIPQIHRRLQGDDRLKGNRLPFQHFHLRLDEGPQFPLLHHPVQGFGNHIVQGFPQQGLAADMAFNDGAGGFALAETGDGEVAHGAPIGTVNKGFLVRRVQGNVQDNFRGAGRFRSNFHRHSPG